ncbi:MAG: bacterial Ig-like domain protein, partial [Verrucomicrobiales bacterium]|nr:bacterial Ig-like domain protein [Verrucomicrobiales bacterium]
GIPFNIVLQPGECYQLRNTNDAPSDLSGTIITSDQPIGVFGSHQCASVPTSAKLFCDYLVEQLLPVNTWGNSFFTAPLATRNGDTFRCIAAYDGTTVSSNGVPLWNLNRGEFQQFSLSSAAQISADHPIFLAQYANSSDADGVVNADPFMLTLQATRHWVNGYRISIPTNDFATNYLNVVALTGAAGTISIDGIPIAPAAFTPIGGSAFSYARPLVTPGAHTVTGGSPFALSVYGWSEYESYGHPACFHFGDVLPPTVTPSVPSVTVAVIADSNTPGYAATPNIAANSTAQDLCDQETRTPTQTPKPGTLVAPGLHTISVFATDTSGNIGKADVLFTVLDPSPVIITCPREILADCGSTDGAIVEFNVTARSTYDTNVAVVSVPASGSLFPPGTTTVISTATSLAGKTDTCSFKVTVNCQGSIRAVQSADGLRLFWTGAPGVLEHASSMAGPWEGLTTGVNEYRVHPGLFQEYFRVRY